MSLQDPYQPLRILVIGAGPRGNAYARAVTNCTYAVVHAIAEPLQQKGDALGKKYIWGDQTPHAGQSLDDWMAYLAYETQRRERKRLSEDVQLGVDGVFIFVHTGIVACRDYHRSCFIQSTPDGRKTAGYEASRLPHNIFLKKLLVEDCVIDEILSTEHTEPVGWWHFSHSYVRALEGLNWLEMPQSVFPVQLKAFASTVRRKSPMRSFSTPVTLVGLYLSWIQRSKICARMREWIRQPVGYGSVCWRNTATKTSPAAIESRPWFGRCVYESDNDVCDDQLVKINWDDDPLPADKPLSMGDRLKGRGA
ncbi:MAG: hypothetical protein Q9192_001777 [Flavoplaca navasiana]